MPVGKVNAARRVMRRRHWGWGNEDDPVGEGAAEIAAHLGFGSADLEAPAPLAVEHDRALERADADNLSVTPYGGGTSVVGGADPVPGPGHDGAMSLDLGRLDRVL